MNKNYRPISVELSAEVVYNALTRSGLRDVGSDRERTLVLAANAFLQEVADRDLESESSMTRGESALDYECDLVANPEVSPCAVVRLEDARIDLVATSESTVTAPGYRLPRKLWEETECSRVLAAFVERAPFGGARVLIDGVVDMDAIRSRGALPGTLDGNAIVLDESLLEPFGMLYDQLVEETREAIAIGRLITAGRAAAATVELRFRRPDRSAADGGESRNLAGEHDALRVELVVDLFRLESGRLHVRAHGSGILAGRSVRYEIAGENGEIVVEGIIELAARTSTQLGRVACGEVVLDPGNVDESVTLTAGLVDPADVSSEKAIQIGTLRTSGKAAAKSGATEFRAPAVAQAASTGAHEAASEDSESDLPVGVPIGRSKLGVDLDVELLQPDANKPRVRVRGPAAIAPAFVRYELRRDDDAGTPIESGLIPLVSCTMESGRISRGDLVLPSQDPNEPYKLHAELFDPEEVAPELRAARAAEADESIDRLAGGNPAGRRMLEELAAKLAGEPR